MVGRDRENRSVRSIVVVLATFSAKLLRGFDSERRCRSELGTRTRCFDVACRNGGKSIGTVATGNRFILDESTKYAAGREAYYSKAADSHVVGRGKMKEMQPMKYMRYLKSVKWDEISKLPSEAKIAWEVAMEELKEGNDKIKHLQAHVRQLKTTVLKAALKTRTKKTGTRRLLSS